MFQLKLCQINNWLSVNQNVGTNNTFIEVGGLSELQFMQWVKVVSMSTIEFEY